MPENNYPQQVGNSDDLDSLVGRSLGQYRIVDRIGAGGMAMVFKAYQSILDRYVAVKVLPAYHARDPVFVKRFVQEARSVARLAHPHIIQIHDFGDQDGITYIVMEYVESGTLKDRLKRALPPTEAVHYVIHAAEGLDCAHQNGIVHRDVKPANMLLRRDEHLLLSDFGIAKILEGTTNLTRVGTGIGTPQYMSPEQGIGQAVDRRSDIYSLGIVLFHCLTGQVPFTADNPLTITVKHLNDPLPVDRLVAANVPAPIIQVVQKMTAKAASDRYQSAEFVVGALRNALALSGLPIFYGARPVPTVDPPVGVVQPPEPQPKPPVQPVQVGAVNCFRCGASNPSLRLYCTACGDDLSNRRATKDVYLVNGHPVLASLSMQNGPMAGRTYRFHQDISTVGRTTGNDLVISGRTVSRRHARLWFDNSNWYVEDVGSANGTFVNNVRIYQPHQLRDGDLVSFGEEVVVFRITYGP
jgi:eukaryotic-like serine/threonine-protein kinase